MAIGQTIDTMVSVPLSPAGRRRKRQQMRRLYLRYCAAGDVVDDVFVITDKQLATTANGSPYIRACLSDCTMQIVARMWNAGQNVFNTLPEEGFVRVRGRIESYQNNLQFIIERIEPAREGTFDLADLIPHTTRNIPEMFARVVELLESIQNRHLAALVHAYLDDSALMEQFRKAPAAMSIHHACIGGLLEHTLTAMEIAERVCGLYPALNRDLVLAGLFLHDIAKTWELSYGIAFDYTDGGQLVGHIVKGAVWVEQRRRQAEEMLGEPIPQPLIDVLQHIIVSHHGTAEFGAIKPPSTPEAIAVHCIEHMDAKISMYLTATRGEAAGSSANWTDYIKAAGARLYRPDPAPADSPEADAAPAASHDDPSRPLSESPVITNPNFVVEKPRKPPRSPG